MPDLTFTEQDFASPSKSQGISFSESDFGGNTTKQEAPQTALQVLKEKGIEGLKQFIQASKNIGAGIVNPPYRVAAHALQGLEQMAGNPDSRVYKNPITGDVVNPYNAATKITEPIGLGLQTAPLVLGLPPTTAGAMFGGGQAMEEGQTPMQVAQNAVIGGALGKAIGLASGEALITGKAGELLRNRIVPALQEGAEKSYNKVLGATTKTEKAVADKITPQLAERKPFVWTRGGLQNAAERNRISANDSLNEAYASLPLGDKVSIKPIIDRVNKAQDGLKVNGVLLEQNTAENTVMEKLKSDLVDMSSKGKASPKTLREYRQNLDSFIAARKKGFAISDADSSALNARRSMANSIRGELAKQYPDIAKLNSEYSLWANISDLLEKTIAKKPGVLSHVGGVIGNVSGHPAAGVLLRNLGGLVNDNAAWNSLAGSMKARVANLLTKGDIEGANISLVGAIKDINSRIPKGQPKVPITKGGSEDPFLQDLWKDVASGGSMAVIAGNTLGQKNNNPINLKAFDKWQGMTSKDKYGHAIFNNLDSGIRAGLKNITNHQIKNPEQTLRQYMRTFKTKKGDYQANYIADKLGISPDTKLKDINMSDMIIPLAFIETRIRLTKKQVEVIKSR